MQSFFSYSGLPENSPAPGMSPIVLRQLLAGLAPLCVFIAVPTDADASYGPYQHGYGVKSLGFGGIGYVAAEDSYPMTANPALASSLGSRLDIGVDYPKIFLGSSIHGNLLGPQQNFESSAHDFFVPQFGVVLPISDTLNFGSTGFAAGLGLDYHDSPYARFGASDRVGLDLGLAGVSNLLSYEPIDGQAIGVAINLGYEFLRIRGLDSPLFKLFSQTPEHLTDQGKEGGFSAGYTIGWHGRFNAWLEAGIAYRSKNWTQRLKQYEGLLPEMGRFDLPAQYGMGIAVRPTPDWTLAFDIQRVLYSEEKATGNGIEQLQSGNALGSEDSPGFGWRDQTIYKFGIAHEITPGWQLRAGYAHASVLIPSSETFFSALAPSTTIDHYTIGTTVQISGDWEISAYAGIAPHEEVHGENSIPTLLGGGEMDLHGRMQFFGISFGRGL